MDLSFAFGYLAYNLEISFNSAVLPEQNDAGEGKDASEAYQDAPVIGVNTTIVGTVGEGLIEIDDYARDDEDLYRLGTVNYGRLNITLEMLDSESSSPFLSVGVYNESDLLELSIIDFSISQYTPKDMDSVVLMASSSYYLKVFTSNKNVSYQLTVDYVELPYTPPSEDTTSTSTSDTSEENTTDTSNTSEESTFSSKTSSTANTNDETTSTNTSNANFIGVLVLISNLTFISILTKKKFKHL